MTGGHDCSRTRGLIDRYVAGSVPDDDRRHAAACPSCAPVLARSARFEEELERSAKQLIGEDLPRGILDPGLSGTKVAVVPLMPALAPGATAGIAALALIVVMATVVGIRPVLLPGPSATDPPFAVEATRDAAPPDAPLWTLNELTVALAESLDYECAAGGAPPSEGAVAMAVCTAPPDAGPFTAAVTLEASDSGVVLRVTISAAISPDIVDATEKQRARDALAATLAKVTAAAFTGPGAGVRAANFVFVKASQLSGPAWVMGVDEGGVRVDLQRQTDGGYVVHLSVA